MLAAAVTDCCRVADVTVRTILDGTLRTEPSIRSTVAGWPEETVIWTNDEPSDFRAAAAEADFALLIAPEFDRNLETRSRWALEAGVTLLGPSPEAVALTADKLALALHFLGRGVPTPQTISTRDTILTAHSPPFVVKQRYGAGSQNMMVCTDAATAADISREMAGGPDTILQPLVTGLPASVAFLIGPRHIHPFLPTEQFVSLAGNFRYLGGRLPLPQPLAARALRIARQAVSAVPGLQGYVGVDLVLGSPADGSGDYAIEINPRLTTSYIGLRAASACNLMETLVDTVGGRSVPNPQWLGPGVSWSADGSVTQTHA
jgi:tyramine---L-glutamate ligase